MNKLKAIIKREYVQGVRSKIFLFGTILGPVMMLLFTVVPGLLFAMKTGDATRIAVYDQTGRLYEHVRESIMRGDEGEKDEAARPVGGGGAVAQAESARQVLGTQFKIEEAKVEEGRSIDEFKEVLEKRVLDNKLDGYLVLPPNILENGEAEYNGRNTGDVISIGSLRNSVSRAVIEQRMREANIAPDRVRELSKEVEMVTNKVTKSGTKKSDDGSSFFFALAVGMFIYISVLTYGHAVLSAVVEEKTTRVAEVLFSSVSAFPLMAGKLIGVSLVALTQFAIWAVVFGALALYGAGMLAASGMEISLPNVPLSFLVYAFLFFLLGFYVYSTLYVLVGSMVTTEKEGGQLALPVIFLLVIGIYTAFPVIRSPGSSFSFWVSMIPFFSPITMMVRIVTETPPFWQIALSLFIGFATVLLLVWVAGRIYRIGMLMYGKRATIPEVLRWVKQS